MTPHEYIVACQRSKSTLFNLNRSRADLLHAAMGMCTESAEFADALKKHIFYDKKLDETNLKEELGDMLWYMAIACANLGVSFEELMATNVKKLEARYAKTFTPEEAEKRNLETERDILENY